MASSSKSKIPPIVEVIEPLNAGNQNTFGEIRIGEAGQLLKRTLEMQQLTDFLTRAFNQWLSTGLPETIRSYKIQIPEVGEMWFEVSKLVPLIGDDGKTPVTPQEARNREMTYTFSIYADAYLKTPSGAVEVVETNRNLGSVPLMIGSSLDVSTGMCSREKLAYGECPYDATGYFIIKGMEKLVIIQEKMRMNRIFCYLYKKKLVVKMTVPTYRGTKEMIVMQGPKPTDGYEMYLEFLGKRDGKFENLPLFLIFKMLGLDSEESIFNYLYRYTKPERRAKIRYQLSFSSFRSASIGDPYTYLQNRKPDWRAWTPEQARENIQAMLLKELFPQIDEASIVFYYGLNPETQQAEIIEMMKRKKMDLLAFMVVRLTETLAGFRPMDDRDSWSNKRLESAARSMEQLFTGIWGKNIDNIQMDINKSETARTKQTVLSEIAAINILQDFNNSFNANNWGVKGPRRKENITEFLSRVSIIDTYSHLTKINAPVNRDNKNVAVRLVQPSQLGYVCSAQTPEGEQCGIVKNLAVSALITIDTDPLPVAEALAEIRRLGHLPITTFLEGEGTLSKIILNGYPYGFGPGRELSQMLIKDYRRKGRINAETAILYVPEDDALYLYTDSSRPVRPLLVVGEDGKLVIDQLRLGDASFDQLLQSGAVEYLDAWEQEYSQLAQNLEDIRFREKSIREMTEALQALDEALESLSDETLYELQDTYPSIYQSVMRSVEDESDLDEVQAALETERANIYGEWKKMTSRPAYTHSEIDPKSQFGIAASLVPLPNFQQGPRTTYQANMGKQALGVYHSNYMNRFDTSSKVLAFPSRPMFETQLQSMLGLNELPTGETVVIAIMPYLGFGQEDAFIFKKSSIERGLFMYSKLSTYESTIERPHGVTERFQRPTHLRAGEKAEVKFRNLDENGIVRVGSYVREGDILISKVREYTNKAGALVQEDVSVTVSLGASGIVRRVYHNRNVSNVEFVKVVVQQVRQPIVGDKFASRYAQKGTIGLILPDADMPQVMYGPNKGLIPDIIINPHSIPSRMTVGKMIEILASKVSAFTGERVNASAFETFDIDLMMQNLTQYGFDRRGNEVMLNGMSGKPIEAAIFSGPCYYQALKHHVTDKIQKRGRGGIALLTGQPYGGRAKEGGQKVGEMEKDAFISHGASATVVERLCLSSDAYKGLFCRSCSTPVATQNPDQNYVCTNPDCRAVGQIVTATLPYSYRLLYHYLGAVGINVQLQFDTGAGPSGTGDMDREAEMDGKTDLEGDGEAGAGPSRQGADQEEEDGGDEIEDDGEGEFDDGSDYGGDDE